MIFEKLLRPFCKDWTEGAKYRNRDTSKELTEVEQVRDICGRKWDDSREGEKSQF